MEVIGLLPPRSFFITAGTVVSLAVMFLLIFLEYKISWRTLIVCAIAGIVTPTSGIGGQIARKLSHGQWLDMGSFARNIFEYEGTHYIGAAAWIMLLAPLIWLIIMRKSEGPFRKGGLMRFMGILSIYAVLQGFIGRIGCLREGCCHGGAYSGPLAVSCVGLDYTVAPALQTELILLFITAVLTVIMYINKKNTAPVFCIGYGVSVFAAEFMYYRAGQVTVFGLTAFQMIAIALIAAGLMFIYLPKRKAK